MLLYEEKYQSRIQHDCYELLIGCKNNVSKGGSYIINKYELLLILRINSPPTVIYR